MRIGSCLGDQQDKQQVDRCAVDSVEINRRVQVHQGADGRLATFETAVGNSDAVAKTGRAEFFTGNQALEDILHLQLRDFPGDQVGNLFKGAFFTAARHVHQGTAGGQDAFKSDHG
ncbi:hypothetical protein D3C85_1453930 [compost metagenome]